MVFVRRRPAVPGARLCELTHGEGGAAGAGAAGCGGQRRSCDGVGGSESGCWTRERHCVWTLVCV